MLFFFYSKNKQYFVPTVWFRCWTVGKTHLCTYCTRSLPLPRLSQERSQPWEWGKPCEFTLSFMNNAALSGGEWRPRGGVQSVIKVSLLLIPSLHFDEQESILFWGTVSQFHSTTTWKPICHAFCNTITRSRTFGLRQMSRMHAIQQSLQCFGP